MTFWAAANRARLRSPARHETVYAPAFRREIEELHQNGVRMQVIGDDFLVTNAALVREAAAGGACNAVLLKPNQAGTVTETVRAMQAAREAGWGMVVSARSGETEDVAIVHLATGWNTGQLKVGSFARSERMAKWNEGLRVEQQIGPGAAYAGGSVLPASRGNG